MSGFGILSEPGMTICPLGQGGQAEVEKVHLAGQDRARKRLLPTSCTEAGRARFQREIDILNLLKDCPYVITVLEDGRYKFDGAECSIPYYVMELAQTDFEHYVMSRTWNNDKGEIIARLYELALAISYSHARDVIHRDVKPKNILILENSVRLCDFGLGKNTGSSNLFATRVGASAGSDFYRAPELSGHFGECSEAADVYSFGMVLLWAISGELPTCTGRRLEEEIDRTGGEFSAFLKKCLALDELDRFQNGTELLEGFSYSIIEAINNGHDITMVIHAGEALAGLSDAIKNGASGVVDDFIAILQVSDTSQIRKLPDYIDSQSIDMILDSPNSNIFLESIDRFNDEVFENDSSFAFVDIVGKFYALIASAVIDKVEKTKVHQEREKLIDLIEKLSKTLLYRSTALNRYEGGRLFIGIFSRGGRVRMEILKNIMDSSTAKARNWLVNDLSYDYMKIVPEVKKVLP